MAKGGANFKKLSRWNKQFWELLSFEGRVTLINNRMMDALPDYMILLYLMTKKGEEKVRPAEWD